MMNIVIIDDEERIRQGLVKLIGEKTICRITGCFSNGIEVLEALSKLQADVIITDIKMPRMNGLELIDRLTSRYPELKFIILTGFSDFNYACRALRLGAVDYLLKPIDKKNLFNVLEKIEKDFLAEKKHPFETENQERGKKGNRIIDTIESIIDDEYANNLELNVLAERVYISPSYLSKLFRMVTGQTITDYITHVRVVKAKQLLREHLELKSYEVGQRVGYGDPVYFNKLFKKMTGMTPKEYKDKN